MDDLLETVDEPEDDPDGKSDEKKDPLHTWVAIAVVILATFMAITKVKDDNIVQAMLQVKSEEVDTWNEFQAKSTKQHLAEVARDQLAAQIAANPALPAAGADRLRKLEDHYTAEAQRYDQEKQTLQKEAEQKHAQYDAWNNHDDQFDLSDAVLSISLALLGVTALTQRRWLFWVAIGLAGFGVIMGVAGLLNLNLHPDALTRLLGT